MINKYSGEVGICCLKQNKKPVALSNKLNYYLKAIYLRSAE